MTYTPAFLVCLVLLGDPSGCPPLEIHSPQFDAVFRCGSLVDLRSGGKVYVRPVADTAPLTIHRTAGEHGAEACTGSSQPGEVLRRYDRFSGLKGARAEATYRTGAEGELSIAQKASSPEPGVWGLSWAIGRIPLDYAIVVPGRSGIRLSPDSPGRRHQFDYPIGWEAQLVVVEGPEGGFFVWAEDDRGRFKRLVVDRNADGWQLTLTMINHAPFDQLTACESVPWRLGVYQGDWRVPARRYRQWMVEHFQPVPIERQKPGWVKDIRAMVIMGQFGAWLRKEKSESEFTSFYRSLGSERKEGGVPLEEAISSLSLLKKHVWMFTYSFGVWEKAVDIYRMFELGERLVYFFDRAAYHTAVGYARTGGASFA
mgnify:CR=1 FL=1